MSNYPARASRANAPVNYMDTRITGSPGAPGAVGYTTNKFGGVKPVGPSHLRNEVSQTPQNGPSGQSSGSSGPQLPTQWPESYPSGPLPLFVPPPGQRRIPGTERPSTQAFYTTYASRLRTGVSSLVQPLVVTGGPQDDFGGALNAAAAGPATGPGSGYASGSATPVATGPELMSRSGRVMRRTVNYAEDAGSIGSDEDDEDDSASDASESRKRRRATEAANEAQRQAAIAAQRKAERERERQAGWSWLGERPPGDRVTSMIAERSDRQFVADSKLTDRYRPKPEDELERAAARPCLLVPIRVEIDTDTHRIRDCFTWNLNERLISTYEFARLFCKDVGLPTKYITEIGEMIGQQVDEYEALVGIDAEDDADDDDDEDEEEEEAEAEAEGSNERKEVEEAVSGTNANNTPQPEEEGSKRKKQRIEEPEPEKKMNDIESDCRIIINLDLQIYTYNLRDRIEWDLGSTSLTPEQFTKHYCAELGLTGEAHSIISHAIHEELLKHKKDALELGLLGPGAGAYNAGEGNRREGPRKMKGVWREWNEREDFGPSLVVMSMDEIERKEQERIRAARRVRRDTAKSSLGRVRYRG